MAAAYLGMASSQNQFVPAPATALDRRRLLQFGAAAAGATVLAACANEARAQSGATPLPGDQIAAILGGEAEQDGPVTSVGIGRNDIERATVPFSLNGSRMEVPFNPGFELGGEFTFQAMSGGTMMNGDFPFLPTEIQPALDVLIAQGIEVQSHHQHYMSLDPMVFFMHIRAFGDPLDIARKIRAMLDTTGVMLPQTSKPNPTTQLDAQMIGRILGDDKPSIGGEGSVSVVIPRTDGIKLGGRAVDPGLNVSSNASFQLLPGGQTAAAPDFGMTADEVTPVLKAMRAKGWDVHCLYNQETAEDPQLYFSHMLKVGDTQTLAREIRAGLDLTRTKRA